MKKNGVRFYFNKQAGKYPPISAALLLLSVLFIAAEAVCAAGGGAADERYMRYKADFSPLKFMGRDYWDSVRDTMIQGYKEGGSIFHFDPDNDTLIKGSAIQIMNAARHTHLESYRNYLLENSDRPILFYFNTSDLSTGAYRTRYFANSSLSDLQASGAKEFFGSKEWLSVKEKTEDRVFGYVYSEGSWQVRPMDRKALNGGSLSKHIGVSKYSLKIPSTVDEYYDYYCRLFKAIQDSSGAGAKLIPIPQFDTGFFLPVKLGAPAAAYYVYANSNYSRRMAFARGAARQYHVPVLIYFSEFVNAGHRLKGRVDADVPYSLTPSLYWKQDALDDLARGRAFNADGWLCSITDFKAPGEKFVGVDVDSSNVMIKGPLCGMPRSQFRQHLYFQYLSGAGFIHYEGQDWAYYDPTPAEKKEPRRYVREGEPLTVDGWRDPLNMPVHNSSEPRKDAIEEKELVFIKSVTDKDVYHSPFTLVRREVVEFARKHGRGTLFAPLAYILDPRWALFNTNMFADEPEENYKPLEKMVFNWRNAAFEGAPLSVKNTPQVISKLSGINTAVNNYSHRREITDVLTTDVSADILTLYPAAVTIGPLPDSFESKITEYAGKGGVWLANVSQLPASEWEKLLGIKFGEKMKGRAWQNTLSGEKVTEPRGYYEFKRLERTGAGVTMASDTESGRPLILRFPYGKGSIILNLQEAAYINDAAGEIPGPAISRAMFSVGETLADEFLPVKVSGNIQSLYNITRDGWTVTLSNTDGVSQPLGKPEIKDMSAARNVELSFKDRPADLRELFSGAAIDTVKNGGEWKAKVKVDPGEMKILSFKLPASI
jgi:hypothetical protein